LCDVFELAGAGLVADAARVLKYCVCRIAVIGQIKVGKSCFITRSCSSTMSHLNSWTTATTNVHLQLRLEG
jgi:GTPase SAR1 family protein